MREYLDTVPVVDTHEHCTSNAEKLPDVFHPVIQKKPYLLQHLLIQQMRFVYDHNQFSVVQTSEQFDLLP